MVDFPREHSINLLPECPFEGVVSPFMDKISSSHVCVFWADGIGSRTVRQLIFLSSTLFFSLFSVERFFFRTFLQKFAAKIIITAEFQRRIEFSTFQSLNDAIHSLRNYRTSL